MKLHILPLAALPLAIDLTASAPVRAQTFAPEQRGEIETIVREYLLSHPEVLQDAMAELDRRQTAADAEKHLAVIKENSEAIFSSPRQVNLGNPQGDVTLVEFFDYNCAFCKKAMSDMLDLLKNDPKLRGSCSRGNSRCSVKARCRLRWSRRRGADAGQGRQEVSGLPPKAPGRTRSGSQGRSTCRRQGGRLRHGAQRSTRTCRATRSKTDHGGELQARRGSRAQRHAEGRVPPGSGRRHGGHADGLKEKVQHCPLRQGDLLTCMTDNGGRMAAGVLGPSAIAHGAGFPFA